MAYKDTILKQQGKAPKVAIPKGYKSNQEFLNEMLERFDYGISADQHNREPAAEDITFVTGDQWDPVVKERRLKQRKPVMTVNRLNAFVAQVVNNRLMNETEIRVLPDSGGTKEIAELRQGIIRSIYKNSEADLARDEALKYQAVCGFGAFCLSIDYAGDDVFDQEIKLKHIADPFSVVFDPLSTEPTGADAEWVFVTDEIPKKEFERRWPNAPECGIGDTTPFQNANLWYMGDTIRVASYWRMVTEGTKTLALMQDGTTQDVTDLPEEQWMPFVQSKADGSPYTREVPNRFARMYVVTSSTVLEGPYDYKISSLPVFRVPGWEFRAGNKLYRWGLVRFMKDPQRLHNYWRSVLAEQLVAAPRNKWLSTREAVAGFEKEWRNSNISDDPLLLYNMDAPPPQRMEPPGLDAGLLNEANMATQDLRDISNIHEASLGMQSNEVSGKAIQARQMVSDVGTFIYHDRLRMADERCAKLINELIPIVYDAQRIVKVVGADNKDILVGINQPFSQETDVTLGKYAVTVTTGPATVTKRALAAEQMMAFVNAVPQSASLVMDLIAEAQDWPKSTEFARRFRMALPPGTVPPDEMPPEMQQMMQQNQQQQAQAARLEQAKLQAEIAKLQADAAQSEAKAAQAQAMAHKYMADAQARLIDAESKADDREIQQTMKAADTIFSREDKKLEDQLKGNTENE